MIVISAMELSLWTFVMLIVGYMFRGVVNLAQ